MEEIEKDLIFYKTVAILFINSKFIEQSLRDNIVMQAIQQINANERPDDLSNDEIESALTGEVSRSRAEKLEKFRLFLLNSKNDGSEMLALYEKNYTLGYKTNEDLAKREIRLGRLIHMAINKAESNYITSDEAEIDFNMVELLNYLRKLSNSKKVKTSLEPKSYYINSDTVVKIDKTKQFLSVNELDKFMKRTKDDIFVSFVYSTKKGIAVDYGLHSIEK